jgi:outer membrane protein assembly factor BamD (BamD/ComL family)
VSLARRLVDMARTELRKAKQSPAELEILVAEVELAEGNHRQAVRSFLAVCKHHPRSSQAEASLFAAAQLALDHREVGEDGLLLLARYIDAYPTGKFINEARLLMQTRGTVSP